MFNPDKDDYPQNENGVAEFASIIVTVDSISLQAEGDDVTQKMVLSTQDLLTALSKITAYFGEPALLAHPTNAQLVAEAGRAANPVFVYITPREGTVQIVCSTPTWDMLVKHPAIGKSSALLCSEKLIEIAAAQLSQLHQLTGSFSNLLLLSVSLEAFDGQQSGSSEGGPGTDAEAMVRTSNIEDAEQPPAAAAPTKGKRRKAKADA